MYKGTCLCGTVTFEITAELSNLLHCHCTFCRKAHGASFVTFASAPFEAFRFTSGQDHMAPGAGPGRLDRHFCSICGTSMPFEEAGALSVPIGLLTDPCPAVAVGHIFVGSRAPWYEITDDVQQYAEFPASMNRKVFDTPASHPSDNPGGSCLCGQVSFEITETPLGMMNCHCDRCKRSRGAAYATNLFVTASGFQWLTGADDVKQYKLPDAERFGAAFCGNCGSLMPKVRKDAETINIPAGCLNGDPGVRPGPTFTPQTKPTGSRSRTTCPGTNRAYHASAPSPRNLAKRDIRDLGL